MQQISLRSYFSSEERFSLTGIYALEWFPFGADILLLAGSSASGAISRVRLSEGADTEVLSVSWSLSHSLSTRVIDGLYTELQNQPYMLSVESLTGNIMVQQMDTSAVLSAPTALQTVSGAFVRATQIEMLTIANQTYLATAETGGAGISLYQVQEGFRLSLVSTVNDTDKSHASEISDLQTARVGNADFVISISYTENGISSYRVGEGGALHMVDSISAKSGLWVAGLSAMLQVDMNGETFLITTASQSNTLAAVRLNEQGVFFITDIVNDTRDTRFSGASALDNFEVDGRDFIVVGGDDGGISLFELLPGGQLFHHQTIIQTQDWDVGAITAISTAILGEEVQIIVSGAGRGGLVQLVLPLTDFGDRIVGTSAADQINGGAGDDMLLGGAGNDRLLGGAGEDVLFADSGMDVLTGGAGADIFVFTADGQRDRITDFELGSDRLHLGEWGRIYDISGLEITRESHGATIHWRDETIDIFSADGAPIEVANWSMESFIF